MGTARALEGVIFFDGVCNLCNAAVRFVIRRDSGQHFKFASLQSGLAKKSLVEYHLEENFRTIVLLKQGKIYLRSDAVLEIARGLKGLWPMLYGFKIIPRFFRDAAYNFIAQHRYRWFGKQDECWIPSPDLNSRFVG